MPSNIVAKKVIIYPEEKEAIRKYDKKISIFNNCNVPHGYKIFCCLEEAATF